MSTSGVAGDPDIALEAAAEDGSIEDGFGEDDVDVLSTVLPVAESDCVPAPDPAPPRPLPPPELSCVNRSFSIGMS